MSQPTSAVRVEEYKRAFAATTIVFFIIWLIVAIGFHLPAKSLYSPPGSPARHNGAPTNWWMIQVSIALGVILAFAYALTINRLDEKYGM